MHQQYQMDMDSTLNSKWIWTTPITYPTMHHFVRHMCTYLLQNGALWDICLMHGGICEIYYWVSCVRLGMSHPNWNFSKFNLPITFSSNVQSFWNFTKSMTVILSGNRNGCYGQTAYMYLSSYPGYFLEPHWISMGLPEISRVTCR